jgi:hypothetical protein
MNTATGASETKGGSIYHSLHTNKRITGRYERTAAIRIIRRYMDVALILCAMVGYVTMARSTSAR